jgi:hypothetical protein
MSERDFRLYCADILDSGNAIIGFVKGLNFAEFCKALCDKIIRNEQRPTMRKEFCMYEERDGDGFRWNSRERREHGEVRFGCICL